MRKLSIVLIIALFALLPLSAQTPVTCGSVISAPGLYVLTENTACDKPIFINSDDVTLNLRGHTLSNSSGIPIAGITTSVGPGNPNAFTTDGTTIRNGTITGFGTAIALSGPVNHALPRTANANIHHLTITGNGRGIFVTYASDVTIHNNDITDNFSTTPVDDAFAWGTGIAAFDLVDSEIKNNRVTGNSSDGIALRFSPTADNMVMKNNASGNGRYGILVSTPSTDNVIKKNKAKWNSATDLVDLNTNCDSNVWKNNIFVTSNMACID